MTVSEIRSLMLEKVIPESLLPQNISVCLMDENAALPELDAFTFLNRLRSLGIGSADFLYLLKGCGAPEEAVSRIEQHPDMNLQTLIVTLEGSGFTPKDYTRMLYTARQLWEHTITMRIDIDDPESADGSEPDIQRSGQEEPFEREASAASEQDGSDIPPEPAEAPEPVKTARQKKHHAENTAEKTDREQESAPVLTARQRKRTIDDLAEELGIAAEIEDEPEEKYTAAQRKRRSENTYVEESDTPVKQDSPKARRNAVIAAAAFASGLLILDPMMDFLGFTAPESSVGKLHFAADSSEIFSEIYTAYKAERIGSGYTQELSNNEQVFGDLLIKSDDGLGVFVSENTIWSAEPEGIGIYEIGSEMRTDLVIPPKDARFVKVVQTESGVAAVYSGKSECGLIGVDDSGELWNCGQSGTLTDIFCDEDIIRLGSVHTPGFTKSFTTDDVLEYLPWTSKDGQQTALSPAEIAVSGSADGCSYAVWGEYNAESGTQNKRLATLGSPIYSGAESFTAAMLRGAGSAAVTINDGKLVSAVLPEVTAYAVGNGIIADAEKSDGGVTVYLRGSDLKPLGAFTTGSEVDRLRISGNVVYVGSGGSTVMAVDITDPAAPNALDLTSADGTVNDGLALCGAVSKNGLTLTLYKIENGKAVQADSFAKSLTASELSSFRFAGSNCFVINGTECSGAAYRYFDGVSVVDEFAELGRSRSLHTLYDDKTGYTAAAFTDGSLRFISGDKIMK